MLWPLWRHNIVKYRYSVGPLVEAFNLFFYKTTSTTPSSLMSLSSLTSTSCFCTGKVSSPAQLIRSPNSFFLRWSTWLLTSATCSVYFCQPNLSSKHNLWLQTHLSFYFKLVVAKQASYLNMSVFAIFRTLAPARTVEPWSSG